MSLRSLNRLRNLLEHFRNDRRPGRRSTRRHRAVTATPEQLERREVLAVTTGYEIVGVQNIDLPQGPTTSQPDAISLHSGGIAVSGTGGGNTDVDIFNKDLTDGGGASNLTGTNSAIAQLSNKNLVIVTHDTIDPRILVTIRSSTGASVVPSTNIRRNGSGWADVVALSGGGFWVATEATTAVIGDSNVQILRRNNNGTSSGQVIVVDSSAARDTRPSLAQLSNGNVVVAWQRAVGNLFQDTQIWQAIYNSNGGVVMSPTLVDGSIQVNRRVDVASISGGYAMVYMDNGWATGTTDITFRRFLNSGIVQVTTNISNPSGVNDFSEDQNPRITRLANNLLVVGWEDNHLGFGDTNSVAWLVDPATGNRLGTQGRIVIGGRPESDDVHDITIAGSANGRINVFQRSITVNDVNGESYTYKRTSTVTSGAETITGDDFIDMMIGNSGVDTLLGGGNNDNLNGGGGADLINGGLGQDVLTGGPGADRFIFTSTAQSPASVLRDSITDFSTPETQFDRIDVAAIDGMAGTPGFNTFTFIGAMAFTAEGQIRAVQQGDDTLLQFNRSGTITAEMEILLEDYDFMDSMLSQDHFIVAAGFASLAPSSSAGSSSSNSRLSLLPRVDSEPPQRTTLVRPAVSQVVTAGRANNAGSKTRNNGTPSSARQSRSVQHRTELPASDNPLVDTVFADLQL